MLLPKSKDVKQRRRLGALVSHVLDMTRIEEGRMALSFECESVSKKYLTKVSIMALALLHDKMSTGMRKSFSEILSVEGETQ
ncbi:MAG: hypothetical protein LBS35_07400 [Synergistaceae bacterium]|nr:hypothetical protein [Synergistaceae bacterium]